MTLSARLAIDADLTALRDILNQIITTGGTTAHMTPMSVAEFKAHYFDDSLFIHTVLDGNRAVEFQALYSDDDGGLAIGSFTDQQNPVKGAGYVVFEATKVEAIRRSAPHINAVIRADNVPGLAYYSKMGFVDVGIEKDVPLSDGTSMDRITKRYTL